MIECISIKKSKKGDIIDVLKIAKSLKKYFTKEALKNISSDLKLKDSLIALKNEKVIGFLIYSFKDKSINILWMAVDKNSQNEGMGTLLVRELIKKSKKKNIKNIEVKTLTDKDNYLPYKKTRDFYYKMGFVKSRYEKAKIKGHDDQIVLQMKI